MANPIVVVTKNGQFWVVNTSPPGTGPGSAAFTQYTIVEGTQADANNIPNGGGMSGPYSSIQAAYSVWRAEPRNQDVSTLTKIEQDLSLAEQDITKTGSGTGGFASNPKAIQNPLTGLAAIGDFFQRLTQANTWVRIGEGILGLILLAVGIARITHAVPVATKVAKAVGTKGLA